MSERNELAEKIHEVLHGALDEIGAYFPEEQGGDADEVRSDVHMILNEFAGWVVQYCAEGQEWEMTKIMESGLLDCLEGGR